MGKEHMMPDLIVVICIISLLMNGLLWYANRQLSGFYKRYYLKRYDELVWFALVNRQGTEGLYNYLEKVEIFGKKLDLEKYKTQIH
jgi:hypothetical protein